MFFVDYRQETFRCLIRCEREGEKEKHYHRLRMCVVVVVVFLTSFAQTVYCTVLSLDKHKNKGKRQLIACGMNLIDLVLDDVKSQGIEKQLRKGFFK